MVIKGNTVLITGGATGIGYALAEAFLQEGNRVIICGRRKEKLLAAQQKHPEIHIKVCDVADDTARRELFAWTQANFGELNILINNAGIQRDIDFTKGEADLLNGENEIRINLEAPIYLTALFIPLLVGKPEATIINVSSGLGFMPSVAMPVYSATKSAMHIFSMTLRRQLSKTGIKVFEAIPPMILDTELNMEGRAKRPIGNLSFPTPSSSEYAAAVMKGLQADSYEIGYGMSEKSRTASRADLDKLFASRDF
jgi:uncharacterized oxidoreductase